MRQITKTCLFLALYFLQMGLHAQQTTIYKAARIYLCDTSFATVEAMVVKGDQILLTGTLDSAKRLFPGATLINYGNNYIYPGLIDAHCHFYGYAKGLNECDLVGTKSQSDAVKRVKKFAEKNHNAWIVGRGWDQNDWADKQYPTLETLDKAFPNIPVFLKRVDGHAAWINTAAAKAAKLNLLQKVDGGEILFKDGKFSGILIDNAVDLVSAFIPETPTDKKISAIQTAAEKCYAVGLTTLDDAGLSVKEIFFLDSLQKKKILRMRIYAMLNAEESSFAWIAQNSMYRTPYMHLGAVKFYLDGALGSRGALLKRDYCDQPGHKGLQLISTMDFTNNCRFLFSYGYQVCVHAIGDSANKIALNTFRTVLPADVDMRWRIEHAQVVDPIDMPKLRGRSIIPSVQPTHATSDAPWAAKRLCDNRMGGAYAYVSLIKQSGILALGTDFPVEDISPIKTFYSAITRLDAAGKLKEPFFPFQSLTRRETLLGMTIWAAIANMEDQEKGSLETGKLADFVVLNQDLMTVPDKSILKTKVVATYIGNQKVYGR